MALLQQILEHNARWVREPGAQLLPHPRKKLAIVTCMDTRLVGLLEPALGIERGDAKVIKNAGATLVGDNDGTLRSLVAAIFGLGCEEVLVIAHRECGMASLDEAALRRAMLARGIAAAAIDALAPSLREWLGAFDDPVSNVREVVARLRASPLLPKSVPIHGLVIDPHSGRLELVVDGSKP